MTNGIAIGRLDKSRDYWHNGTCSSGYEFDGDVLGLVLGNFLGVERKVWSDKMFKEYSSGQKISSTRTTSMVG